MKNLRKVWKGNLTMKIKKTIAWLSSAILALSLVGTLPASAVKTSDYTKGINVASIVAVEKYLLRTTDQVATEADLDESGSIDAIDVVLHKQILMGALKTEDPEPIEDNIQTITATTLTSRLKIGWNLGNTLDATGGETSWGNPSTNKGMIDAVKAAGFNTVRLPVTWDGHMGSAPDYRVDDGWMNRIQEVVNYVIDNDMYCILNIHHENDWLVPKESNKANTTQQLAALWKQIATRFEKYDEHLIFEGMNEPRLVGDPNEWNGGNAEARSVINSYNQTFVETVRSTDGNNDYRCLMLPTYAASCMDSTINDFVVPKDDVANKLILSIHSYSPYSFALDGNGTTSFTDSDLYGLEQTISSIHNAATSKGLPVVIGEMGARDKNNLQDRVRWGEAYIRIASSYGIPCCLWDNGAFSGNGELFGYLNRYSCTFQFPDIIQAMMKGLEANQ